MEETDVSTGTLDERVCRAEHQWIRKVLEKTNYDLSAAADELGISSVTLYRKVKKYQMSLPKRKIVGIPVSRTKKVATRGQSYLFDAQGSDTSYQQ